jgi:hypothetical protein
MATIPKIPSFQIPLIYSEICTDIVNGVRAGREQTRQEEDEVEDVSDQPAGISTSAIFPRPNLGLGHSGTRNDIRKPWRIPRSIAALGRN